MREACEPTEDGVVPKGDGWLGVNARDVHWTLGRVDETAQRYRAAVARGDDGRGHGVQGPKVARGPYRAGDLGRYANRSAR